MPDEPEEPAEEPAPDARPEVTLGTIATQWGRIGCTGFGGPPTHIAMLRSLVVEREGWLEETEFEDAIAATNLLPGPASTQLAIFCAWRLRGLPGALVGGACFICPGLAVIIALAALFLVSNPPTGVKGAALGAGAAVAAVAVNAALGLIPASWRRAGASRARHMRWIAYALAGGAAAATLGTYLVLVLLGCGVVEVACSGGVRPPRNRHGFVAAPLGVVVTGGLGALTWVALKVGALSFGGGFVIIPLMQADAVHRYHWMTDAQFLNAVALGQITPGPVVQTVAVVGYAAAGIGGALLAALVAFSPSFLLRRARGAALRRVPDQPRRPVLPRGCRSGGHRRHRRCGHPSRARHLPRVAGGGPRRRIGRHRRAAAQRGAHARRRGGGRCDGRRAGVACRIRRANYASPSPCRDARR